MKYTDAIKKGFDIVNKNWQLVLIQFGAMFASFVGFFIIVGLPLAFAFIIFGLDLTGLSRFEDLFSTFKSPSEIISKYFWLVVLILASLLFYVMVILVIGIFILGGSLGVISRHIKDTNERFSIKAFFQEGKRLFFPLTGFTTLIGLIFILLAFILGLFGGSIAAIVTLAKEREAVLALFLGVFFSLILFIIGMTFILAVLAVTIYGAAIMILRGSGPLRSIKDSIIYLYKHARAFYLYCMVFCGYLALILFIMLISYPMNLIPLIGPLITFVFQFGIYAVQSYLGLVMIAAIFYYYFSTTGESAEKPISAVSRPTSESSTQLTDTSESQVHKPEDAPPEKYQSE